MNKEKDIFLVIFRKIPKNVKICFSSGMIIGLLTHFYMLTHKLPNWDDITNMNQYGSGAEYGRWFLETVYHLFGKWSIPEVNGVLTIIFLSVAACFLLLVLDLQTVTSAILIPVTLVTFPGVACIMTYMFTTHLYAFGIMLCCMGAYCFKKYQRGFIPAMILFILSCGIYQSYICLASGILVFCLVLDLLKGDSFKKVMGSGIKTAATLGISLLLYVGVSKILAPFLTNDRGISTMGEIDILRLPRLIMRSYKRILEYFVIKPYSFTSPIMHLLNITVCILIIVMLLWIAREAKVFKEASRTILLLFLTAMIPLALAAIYVLAPETQDATMLMLFQYFFVYMIVVALAERCLSGFSLEKMKMIISQIIGVGAVLVILLVSYNQYRVTNEAYFRMEIAFDRVYSYYTRMIGNIENQPEYQYGDAIAVLGDFYPDLPPIVGYAIDDYKFEDMSGIATEKGLMTSGIRTNFLRIYLGIQIPDIEREQIEEIKASEVYKAMPDYPAEGSLQRIQDIWIIKVHEDE